LVLIRVFVSEVTLFEKNQEKRIKSGGKESRIKNQEPRTKNQESRAKTEKK